MSFAILVRNKMATNSSPANNTILPSKNSVVDVLLQNLHRQIGMRNLPVGLLDLLDENCA
jgi:hypothetical protein